MESAILTLEAAGDRRSLIGFVEAWNAVGTPTPAARLAQARAFVDFCMLDRAWIRLKELTESNPEDLGALKVTARMFVLRGWPNRARKPLEQGLALAPDDPELQELWDLAADPPNEPDATLEEADSPEILLPLAESYMATGAMLKARALLARLQRDHGPDDRVDDLLWALAGDYSLGEMTLTELADRYGPDLSMLADLAEDAEHTESVTKEELRAVLPESKDAASFPSLFRDEGDATQDTETTEEVTTAMALADLDDLRQSVQAARSAAGYISGEEDTQIRRVIRRDDRLDVTDAGDDVHVKHTMPADVDFDLGRFRQDMGMTSYAATVPESDLDDPLEEEDDDLIILTKRERDGEDTGSLDPDPTSESVEHPDAQRFLAEAERYKRMEAHTRPDAPTPDEIPTQPPRRRRSRVRATATPVWLLVLAFLLGILAFFLTVVVAIQFLT